MKSNSVHPNTEGADLLRGVAILIVIAYHLFGPLYGYYLPWDGWYHDFNAAPRMALWLYPLTFGWAGVPLFFVISGFCIHFSYLRSVDFNALSFFWRRFWRIYPTYFIALLFFTACFQVNILEYRGAKLFFSHLFLIHNFNEDAFFSINASFWSLATEVQLYLLFPALLFLRAKIGIKSFLAISFILGCIWRLLSIQWWGLPDHVIFWAWSSPFMTWFDWSLGALVAEKFHAGKRAFTRPGIWLIFLTPIFILSTMYKPSTAFSFTLAATFFAIVLDMSLHVKWQKTVWQRLLMFIGVISYSLYLWHQELIFRIPKRLTPILYSPVVAWIAAFPVLIAGAWLSYRLLERPGIKLGRWLWIRFSTTTKPVLVPLTFSTQSGELAEVIDAIPGNIALEKADSPLEKPNLSP